MCGRYALHATMDDILLHFQLKIGFSMRSRFNITPNETVPIIMQWGKQIEFARWGYIPSWAKSDNIPVGHINIRLESAAQKPSFKKAFFTQRCLIPASGYFEWRTFSNKKQPYYLKIRHLPLFAFAGLWSIWRTPSGENLLNFGIITQNAPEFLTTLHQRIPVIISPDHYRVWLENDKTPEIDDCFLKLTEENVCFHAVTPRMNHPRFEGQECIQLL